MLAYGTYVFLSLSTFFDLLLVRGGTYISINQISQLINSCSLISVDGAATDQRDKLDAGRPGGGGAPQDRQGRGGKRRGEF